MMRKLAGLERYTVHATDGDIGTIGDFLIDDQRWIVRYLVVDTAGTAGVRQVLISPISFGKPDWNAGRFNLKLTREKIKSSPSIDADKPVSRQQERELHRYYNYPAYWGSWGLWGAGAFPGALSTSPWAEPPATPATSSDDVHLRSANEVRGYRIHGSDKPIGHIEDFIVDDETWSVRYLAVDTRNWWYGKKVLVAPQWASRISWAERKVHLDLSRQAIKDSPEWDGGAAIDRDYEAQLHAHYALPMYGKDDDRLVDRPQVQPRESQP